MKILCKKCNENISSNADLLFEQFTPGKVECKKCKYEDERYVSEADILLYFGLSEVIYVLISLLTNLFLNNFGFSFLAIVLMIIVIVIYFFIEKRISRYIYIKAPFKNEWKNYIFNENPTDISKSIRWQFMLFFAIAITFMMEDTANTIFGILMILSVVLTFIKFALAIKKEKGIVSDSKIKIEKNN